MFLSPSSAKFIRFSFLAILVATTFFQYLPISSVWTISIVVLLTILLWAMQLFPPWLVALLFMTVCCLGKLAVPSLALQGFVASGTWLVFAGLIIGAAMKHTGLAAAIAIKMAPWLKRSFARTLIGFMCFGVICVFLMPSAMGRVVLLLPIFKALAIQLGYEEESEGYSHLLLAGVFATYMPAFAVLPANVPNTVLLGATEALFGHGPSYLQYLVVHFPILGLVKLGLIFLVLWLPLRNMLPPSVRTQTLSLDNHQAAVLARRKLMYILAGMLLLWVTEPWHHLATAWIAVLAVIFCFLPGMNVLPEKPLEKFNFAPMLYVAGVISLGAVASHSAVVGVLAEKINLLLLNVHPSNGISFLLLSALASIMGLLVTLPAAPAVLTPLTTSLAHGLGLSLSSVYMTQIIGLSTFWLPYQAPPLIIAKTMGNLSWKKLTRYCLILAGLSLLILWPLDYIWWKILSLL